MQTDRTSMKNTSPITLTSILRRAIKTILTMLMAFFDDHERIKVWCQNRINKWPSLTEKILEIRIDSATNVKIDPGLDEIARYYQEPDIYISNIDFSDLPPKARLIYRDLENCLMRRGEQSIDADSN